MANEDENPEAVQRAARAHADAVAKLRAQADQSAEGARILGLMVAGYFKGLTEGGVPESFAVFIVNGYVDTVLRIGQQPPPQAGGQ